MDASKTEVLRYLGYRGQALTPELEVLVDECMAECRAASKPLYLWREFDISLEENAVRLGRTPLLLEGKDILRHLGSAKKAVAMAATLGVGADSLIRRWEYGDLTRSVILDACATQLIEEVCDQMQDEVAAHAVQQGLFVNFRYSPGYGDLSLDVQPVLLGVLDTSRKIGLTCTGSHILLPRKSVTALIGLLEQAPPQRQAKGCATCLLRDTCQYAKEKDGHASAGCHIPRQRDK